ncbi:g107 [Yersinia phage phiR1-37]|uniref:HNH endonuclease n=1 Tax=Yersinia phage phiR1-37 TaxID=331278 RepID=UPI00022DBD17|nr:HNH endonuclease [Yersinia phage phiR1-37]CCE26131.1 g107 [Yersinia phage phiR1-37]
MKDKMQKILDNIKKDENGCWIWQRSLTGSGYGQIFAEGRNHSVHKYVFELINGKVPNKYVVRHKCHNRKCCNPDHLLSGTNKDNYHDSIEVFKKIHKSKRLKWIINDVSYPNSRISSKITKLSQSIICKHMDKETRIFDYDSYAKACKIANVEPKKLPTLKTLTKEQKKLIEDNM